MFWKIIWKNLIGFDLVIFIAAALNGVVFYLAYRYAKVLYQKLHLTVFVPSHRKHPEKTADAVLRVDEEEVINLRKYSEGLYAVFVNVTAIFPLLGILGTVISLIPMVSDMADMQQNFFAALTSTFWGLIFAIIFKLLDGLLSSKIEDNDKNVSLLLSRKGQEEEVVS